VVTEGVTAGALAAGAAAVAGAAAAQPGAHEGGAATQVMGAAATQVMGPGAQAMDSTQVMGSGAPAMDSTQVMGSGVHATGQAGAQTEVFSPVSQAPAPAGPPPASIRPQPPVQQGYPTYAQPPVGQQPLQQSYPGQQGYPGQPQPPGPVGPPSDVVRPQPSSYPEPQPPQRDEPERGRDGRGDDDAGWRFVSMLLGVIPAVLLGIAVYQVIRLIPGFGSMPDMSQAPLFRALGDWLVATLNLPWEWSDTMANLAIPLLGLVLAGVLNMVTRVAGKAGTRRRRLWPYFLTIGVWIVVLGVQGVVAAVNESVEKARDDIGRSIERGIEDQRDNLQDQIEEQAREKGESFLDAIWPF
jgi:hypothetical protein